MLYHFSIKKIPLEYSLTFPFLLLEELIDKMNLTYFLFFFLKVMLIY